MLGDQQCTNYLGQHVALAENVLDHILKRHPEMDAYINSICHVLAVPDLVYSHVRTKTHWYYELGICADNEAGTYMLVIVGYNDGGAHRVKTSHAILSPVETTSHVLIFPRGE